MIKGIGTDLVEIERIRKACERPGFAERVFTEEERRQAEGRSRMLAGDFAVKEAVSKVLGCGLSGIAFSEVETLRLPSGKPEVRLSGRAEVLARDLGIRRVHVSMTNTDTLALVFVVAEGDEE